MRLLLLIPYKLAPTRHEAVRSGRRPQTDYDALAEAVRSRPGWVADILDLNSVETSPVRLVRFVRRTLGDDVALALLAHLRSRDYDAVFSHGESTGIPFALFSCLRRRRPRFVTNAYYLSGRKHVLWFGLLRLSRQIDKIMVLVRDQYDIGRRRLRIPDSRLVFVDRCGYVDSRFFTSDRGGEAGDCDVCSAGLEFRDYETLIRAVADLPHVRVKIDPSSPWSRHRTQFEGLAMPPNVEICRMELGSVRQLYAASAAVVIPLRQNSIGAGTTTLVEAMLSGKPVIVTSSPDGTFAGRLDLVDGENVLLVRPGDVNGWRTAIDRLLTDGEFRARVASKGRAWAQAKAAREPWLEMMIGALRGPEAAAAGATVGYDTTNLARRFRTP